FLHPPSQSSSLCFTPAFRVLDLKIPENLSGGEFWPRFQPTSHFLPDALKGIFSRPPIMRPIGFLIPFPALLSEQGRRRVGKPISRNLRLCTLLRRELNWRKPFHRFG